MKKIIYIMGAGRSGTTLLDVVLGNGDNLFSCGELNRYPKLYPPKLKGLPNFNPKFNQLVRENPEACQKDPNYQFFCQSRQFWQQVRETLTAKQGGQIDFQRIHKLHARYEYHSAFFKKQNPHSKAKQAYNTFIRHLYESIFEQSGAEILLDSSKYPMRALQLAEILPYDLSYLYIKRDPRGVMHSFEKPKPPPKNWVNANVYYLTVNMICRSISKQLQKKHPVLEIGYEDLIFKPEQTLKQIETHLDINLTPSLTRISNQQPLQVGYLFAGNPAITQKPQITLQQNAPEYPTTLKNIVTRVINTPVYKP